MTGQELLCEKMAALCQQPRLQCWLEKEMDMLCPLFGERRRCLDVNKERWKMVMETVPEVKAILVKKLGERCERGGVSCSTRLFDLVYCPANQSCRTNTSLFWKAWMDKDDVR